jgi:hypothetical protein
MIKKKGKKKTDYDQVDVTYRFTVTIELPAIIHRYSPQMQQKVKG